MKMTQPRKALLTLLEKEPGLIGSLSYQPLKWALDQGFVTTKELKYGGLAFTITDAGRAAIKDETRRA